MHNSQLRTQITLHLSHAPSLTSHAPNSTHSPTHTTTTTTRADPSRVLN